MRWRGLEPPRPQWPPGPQPGASTNSATSAWVGDDSGRQTGERRGRGSSDAPGPRLTPSGRFPTLRDEHTFVEPTRRRPVPAETPLTARQQEIWQFLVTYVDGHGYPPTVREIGEEVGLASPSTVHAHLANLERVGLIRRDPTKPRAIELTRHRRVVQPAAESVPRVPLLAEENVEDVVAVPETLGRGAGFLPTVHGDSMIEAGILDGDTIVVQR